MAKRVEMIAPFEALRGNVSGVQNLQYAENDNPAFYGPVGRKNYARNYKPRFIVSKRGDGLVYFGLKTKSANHLTTRSQKVMSLLGGAGAIYASMIRRKDLPPYQSMMQLFNYNVVQLGYDGSFRKFVMDFLRRGLSNKVQNFTAQVASISVSFKNPWYDGTYTDGASVSQVILVKFWEQLSVRTPITFSIEGSKGIGFTPGGNSPQALANMPQLNILSLTPDSTSGKTKSQGLFVINAEGEYLSYMDGTIANGAEFTLTDVAPE